jgi:hypothetical protein
MATVTHFRNIRESIEVELLKAVFDIYVAVAWLTDKSLFDILCIKAKEGVNVRIILVKDEINRGVRFDHRDIEKHGGRVFFRSHHHKFCIIDRKILINGSCNWTYTAFQRQIGENISVINDESQAMNFAKLFLELIKRPVETHDYDFTDDYELKFIASFQRVIDDFSSENFFFALPENVDIKELWTKFSHKPAFINRDNLDEKYFIIITPELREVIETLRDKLFSLPVFGIINKHSGRPFNNYCVLGLESNNGQRFDPTWTW